MFAIVTFPRFIEVDNCPNRSIFALPRNTATSLGRLQLQISIMLAHRFITGSEYQWKSSKIDHSEQYQVLMDDFMIEKGYVNLLPSWLRSRHAQVSIPCHKFFDKAQSRLRSTLTER